MKEIQSEFPNIIEVESKLDYRLKNRFKLQQDTIIKKAEEDLKHKESENSNSQIDKKDKLSQIQSDTETTDEHILISNIPND